MVNLKPIVLALLACVIAVLFTACDDLTHGQNKNAPNNNLKIVIIRHAEKPSEKPADNQDGGDNLSCQGQNRALQLATVLFQKIGKPDYTYVPALGMDKKTAHSRMFQTVTPFAVKYNLTINSKYQAEDYVDAAESALKKSGTVLMVWSHSEMADLADALGVNDAPKWDDADFDRIWTITYRNGKAHLTVDSEGINPQQNCSF